MLCDECGGSGQRLSPAIAKLRGKPIAYVECRPCMGFGAFNPLVDVLGPAEIGPGARRVPTNRPRGA